MQAQVPKRVILRWLRLQPGQDIKLWTYIVLLLLVIQNMTSIILQHTLQSQSTTSHDRFEPLSGIILIEISKLAISSICVMHSDTGPSLWEGFSGTLLTASNNTLVSAVLFTVATVLQSMGVHYLDLIPYLVLSQLKTLVTPVFARIILNQKYPLKNWIFIALMSLGIVLAQLGSSSDKTSAKGLKVQSMMRGAIVMLLAGVCVAIGSLCIEKTMKRSGRLFLCNAQLAAYSSTFALFYFCWFTKFSFGDFFRGFDIFVWIYLVLQVSGGFLVARCVQMTSTVTKNYAQGLGFVLAVVVPRLVTHQHISLELLAGVGLVLASVLGSSSFNQRKPAMDEMEQKGNGLNKYEV